MELLLVTPVPGRILHEGHRGACRRIFIWPWIVLSLAHVGFGIAGRVVAGGDWPDSTTLVMAGFLPALWQSLVHALDLLAVEAYATFHALRSDRPARVLLRSVVMIILVPYVFCLAARFLVDLLVLGQKAPHLERFRDLARGWYFRGPLDRIFGAPRSSV